MVGHAHHVLLQEDSLVLAPVRDLERVSGIRHADRQGLPVEDRDILRVPPFMVLPRLLGANCNLQGGEDASDRQRETAQVHSDK